MLNRSDAKQEGGVTGAAGAVASSRSRTRGISRGQSLVEFALLSAFGLVLMVVGVQYALLGEAALAVSQGSSALARYIAVNSSSMGLTNAAYGPAAPTAAMQSVLSSSILTGTNDGDLQVTVTSYSGTSGNTTSAPVATVDRLQVNLTYTATSKIVLPNPFMQIPHFFPGIEFPTTLSASDSQMYE